MTRHAIDYREYVMHRTIPSAKQMEDSQKTHYFRDDDDNRLVVITEFRAGFGYGAWLEDDSDGPHGLGDTMMEAIASLYNQISSSDTCWNFDNCQRLNMR